PCCVSSLVATSRQQIPFVLSKLHPANSSTFASSYPDLTQNVADLQGSPAISPTRNNLTLSLQPNRYSPLALTPRFPTRSIEIANSSPADLVHRRTVQLKTTHTPV